MKRHLRHLIPVRIGGQIAALTVASLLLAHAIMTGAFFLFNAGVPHPTDWVGIAERLVVIANLLNRETNADAHTRLLADARLLEPGLEILRDSPPAEPPPGHSRALNDLQKRLGGNAKLFFSRAPNQTQSQPAYLAVAGLSDGTFVALPFHGPLEPPPLISSLALGTLVFLGIAVALLSLWAARQLTAPLARLADAAEQFTIDATNTKTELVESGPIEVQRTARALSDMQDRVLKLIADRTRMLAAVSHDLRTPITRLRLRAEEIEPESLRAQFLRDLTVMQNLVQSSLAFLRGQYAPMKTIKADLATLVQTVCDDVADAQGHVYCHDLWHAYVECEPDQLMRAITNLIQNGLKFGGDVDVRMLENGNDTVSVEIQDKGPGIPDAEKVYVTEPFYRGDSARSLAIGESFGLGLSIAKTIVERHRGALDLLDGSPHGLLARIVLPTAHPTEPDERVANNLAAASLL